MNKRNILILVTLLCCCTTISASKWRVNNAPSVSADFNDLETALQSEQVIAGDTLYVEGSPYVYAISDMVKKVTLIGPGYYLTENPGTQENKAAATIKNIDSSPLYILAVGIVFEGLTFDNTLYLGADNITLKRCSAGTIYWGNKASSQEAIRNTVITQCIVESIEGNNKAYSDYSNGALVTNNIVNRGISYLYNAVIEYNTCLGGHYSWGSIYNTDGSGSIRHNVLYYPFLASQNGTMTMENNYQYDEGTSFVSNTTSSDGKYQIAASSDLKNKAPGGGEVGAFGGSSPYILSGLPGVPHIYEISAPTSASAASGLEVILRIGN